MSTRQDSSIKTAGGYLRDAAWFASLVFIALAYLTSEAAYKPMIEYFKPIPLVGKLTTSGWGYNLVGPHDPSNGLENTAKWWYWDGKIMKAPNGKYHMFASRWDVKLGISAWMGSSISVHAVSDSLLGPYRTWANLHLPEFKRPQHDRANAEGQHVRDHRKCNSTRLDINRKDARRTLFLSGLDQLERQWVQYRQSHRQSVDLHRAGQ